MAIEHEQLKDCTFRPQITPATAPPPKGRARRKSAPVIVRGLGRHLQLREAARRKKEEQREREEAAFNVNARCLKKRDGGLYTVPQPFHLSTSK